MRRILIEEKYFEQGPSPLEGVCWLARELLGGYMDTGVELELDDEDTMLRQFSEDDEEIPIIIFETPPVQINQWQHARLSNQPFIFGIKDELIPFTSPGYVALVLEPAIEQDINNQALYEELFDQRIFRQPNPVEGEDAAIFRGHSLEIADSIPATQTKEIANLRRVLTCMQVAFRLGMQQDTDTFDNSHLSQYPLRPQQLSEDTLDILRGIS